MSPRGAEELGEALVLARHAWRDGFIVSLLASQSLRRDMVAPRAARSKARLAAHLDTLNRCEVGWREEPQRDLPVLTRATAWETFPTLRGDLERLALGLAVCEVVGHILADGAEQTGLYELTLGALRALDDPQRAPSEDLLLYFEFRALGASGVLEPLAHASHRVGDAGRSALESWAAGKWRGLDTRGRREVAAWLEGQLAELSGRPLKSRTFLEEVRAMPR